MQIDVDKVFPVGISGSKQLVCDLIQRETCLSVLKTARFSRVSISASFSLEVFQWGKRGPLRPHKLCHLPSYSRIFLVTKDKLVFKGEESSVSNK